ncbi:MAG: hypothetical protein ABJG15_11095 [Hyphomonadaceae bacterium]
MKNKLASVFLALIAFGSAPAQAQQAPEFAGSWTFKAWIGQACEFTGIARISPIPDADGTYTCQLTANQSCELVEWTVRQTCIAKPQGDRLWVKSEIAEFIGDTESSSYLPDDFLLTIDSAKRMFGALHSAGVFKAEWIRDEGVTS